MCVCVMGFSWNLCVFWLSFFRLILGCFISFNTWRMTQMKKLIQSHLQPQNLQKHSGYGVWWCFNITCLCGGFDHFGSFWYVHSLHGNWSNLTITLKPTISWIFDFPYFPQKGSWHIFQLQVKRTGVQSWWWNPGHHLLRMAMELYMGHPDLSLTIWLDA